jgi:hypothetical protein
MVIGLRLDELYFKFSDLERKIEIHLFSTLSCVDCMNAWIYDFVHPNPKISCEQNKLISAVMFMTWLSHALQNHIESNNILDIIWRQMLFQLNKALLFLTLFKAKWLFISLPFHTFYVVATLFLYCLFQYGRKSS